MQPGSVGQGFLREPALCAEPADVLRDEPAAVHRVV